MRLFHIRYRSVIVRMRMSEREVCYQQCGTCGPIPLVNNGNAACDGATLEEKYANASRSIVLCTVSIE